MNKILNFWDTNFYKCSINTIEDFEEYVKNNDVDFIIKDKYVFGSNTESLFENIASNNNCSINYIDENHQVIIFNDSFVSKSIISSKFYEKYKERINNCLINKKYNLDNLDSISIPNYLFSDELLNKVIDKCKFLILHDINLTKEQIEKIQDRFIDCILYKGDSKIKISSSNLFSNYTKEDVDKNNIQFIIDEYLTEKEIENLKYLKNNARIKFNYFEKDSKDKSNIELLKIIKNLDDLEKNINIIIELDKRIDIIDWNFNELKKLKNINIKFKVDGMEYTFDEYLNESNKLDNLVSNIKNSNMSPLEKYMAVYSIVKNYKPYKENKEDLTQSRYVKYLLDNEYMVCVGYSSLLGVLLERVQIESAPYGTSVYIASEDENGANKDILLGGGHARQLIHIVDKKYNIDGYYIADPTWDNCKHNLDTYDYALLPIDTMQKSKNMFQLEDNDYFLDVHTFDEYNKKVNILINKEYNSSFLKSEDTKERLMRAYNNVYSMMINIVKKLDSKKYSSYSSYTETPIYDRNEKFYIDFFTDFGNYIITKTNKPISHEVIASAAAIAKNNELNNKINNLKEYKDFVLKQLDEREVNLFPYEMDIDERLKNKVV